MTKRTYGYALSISAFRPVDESADGEHEAAIAGRVAAIKALTEAGFLVTAKAKFRTQATEEPETDDDMPEIPAALKRTA